MLVFVFRVLFFLIPLTSTSFTDFLSQWAYTIKEKEVVQKAVMFVSAYIYDLENKNKKQ